MLTFFHRFALSCLVALVAFVLLLGCGGTGVAANRMGTASFTVLWPKESRLIPARANSIRIVLSTAGVPVAEKIIPRPAQGDNETSTTFTNLPPIELLATATAYPNNDASGTPMAAGSSTVRVDLGKSNTIVISLGTTISRLAIAPSASTLAVGETLRFSAQAFDASGQVVLLSASKLSWTSTSAAVATVASDGTVTGRAAGTTRVCVTDSESGKDSPWATITVGQNGGISVSVQPKSVELGVGATHQFAATVSGTDDKRVAWWASGGTISASGLFTAPASAGSYQVIATSAADTSRSDVATVIVASAGETTIVVDPSSASLKAGESMQFTAIVTNASNKAVTWTVVQGGGGSVANPSANPCTFTAPSSSGQFTLRATHDVTGKYADATVNVTTDSVSLSIQPVNPTVSVGGTQEFTAYVDGKPAIDGDGIAWDLPGSSPGSLSMKSGPKTTYTAPLNTGTATVRAIHKSKTEASVSVSITDKPTITISPTVMELDRFQEGVFHANVNGSTDKRLKWTIEPGGPSIVESSDTFCKVKSNMIEGTFRVTATLVANPNVSAPADVVVIAQPAEVQVNSENPASGINIKLDPPDRDAKTKITTGGSTTRAFYKNFDSVSLWLDRPIGTSNPFKWWKVSYPDGSTETREGETLSLDLRKGVTTATAVFLSVFEISVGSYDPSGKVIFGAPIKASRPDVDGKSDLTTWGSFRYVQGSSGVQLTAQAWSGWEFLRWKVDGDFQPVDNTSTPVLSLASSGHSVHAIYGKLVQATILADAADGPTKFTWYRSGKLMGEKTTPAKISFLDGEVIKLDAVARSGNNGKWKGGAVWWDDPYEMELYDGEVWTHSYNPK